MQMVNTALITGATGFLGSALAKRLVQDGFKVRALSSGIGKKNTLNISEKIEWFPISEEGIAAAIPGVTHFFNFAVIYDRPIYSDELINQVNVVLPLKILSALEFGNTPVICVLGDSFYRKYPYTATAQVRYTRSKNILANSVMALSNRSANCYAMLLIEQLYGPGDRLDKVFPRVIYQLLDNFPRIPLTEGWQSRDFIHIADVIDAIMFIARTKWSGVIDVGCGSGISTQVRSVFKKLKTLTLSSSVLGFGDLPADQSIDNSIADIGWLQEQGWSCNISLDDGLKDFVNEIRQRYLKGIHA